MSQYWALLSLVFMIGYVFMFDKIRWQLGRTTPRSETGTVWAPTYGGYSCHPYRKWGERLATGSQRLFVSSPGKNRFGNTPVLTPPTYLVLCSGAPGETRTPDRLVRSSQERRPPRKTL